MGKGEIVVFAMRTAVEFATRQRTDVDQDEIVWIRIQTHSLNVNGWWQKCRFDCANRPVYKQGPKFLYCNGDHWAISDSIQYAGQYMTKSVGPAIRDAWVTPQPWKTVDTLVVRRDSEHTVIVKGPPHVMVGNYQMVTADLERRGFKGQLDSHCHYIKAGGGGGGGHRCHLFYSAKQSRWLLAPTCEDTGLIYARSVQLRSSNRGDGGGGRFDAAVYGMEWEVPSPDSSAKTEPHVFVTGYTEAEAQREFVSSSQVYFFPFYLPYRRTLLSIFLTEYTCLSIFLTGMYFFLS
jgi:hypothetical protein